jgi:hypothetical protein
MKEFEKAHQVAKKMLGVCPGDNIGARFILEPIACHEKW